MSGPLELRKSPVKPPPSGRPAFGEEQALASEGSNGRSVHDELGKIANRSPGLKLPPLTGFKGFRSEGNLRQRYQTSNPESQESLQDAASASTPLYHSDLLLPGTQQQRSFDGTVGSDDTLTPLHASADSLGGHHADFPGALPRSSPSSPAAKPSYATVAAAAPALTYDASSSPQPLPRRSPLERPPQMSMDLITTRQELQILVVTWNMANRVPPRDLAALLGWAGPGEDSNVGAYDLCVIGVQEAHDIDKWEASLVAGFEKSTNGRFYHVQSARLDPGGWIHMSVFVHHNVLPAVRGVQRRVISTGIGNVIGNKGAVGVTLCVDGVRMAFVNAHFQAHQNNVKLRNQDFHRINSELFCRTSGAGTGTVDTLQTWEMEPLTEAFDAVVWLGDLNYRVGSNRKAADMLIQDGMLEVMRANDQLIREMQKGHVFHKYREGVLWFPPTYKYDKEADTYDSSEKQRVPSWTDRILYTCQSTQNEPLPKARISLQHYGPVESVKTSDHRPVAARLTLGLLRPTKDGSQALYQDSSSRTCIVQ